MAVKYPSGVRQFTIRQAESLHRMRSELWHRPCEVMRMTSERESICPKCQSRNVHQTRHKQRHIMYFRCRVCWHPWEQSLLSQFPNEADLERMAAALERRHR